jgi:hypothetical protein
VMGASWRRRTEDEPNIVLISKRVFDRAAPGP